MVHSITSNSLLTISQSDNVTQYNIKFTLSNTNIHTLAHIDLITTKQGTRTRDILFLLQINIKVAYYGTHYSEFIVVKHEWYLFYKNI